jgi:hypothetical protein
MSERQLVQLSGYYRVSGKKGWVDRTTTANSQSLTASADGGTRVVTRDQSKLYITGYKTHNRLALVEGTLAPFIVSLFRLAGMDVVGGFSITPFSKQTNCE